MASRQDGERARQDGERARQDAVEAGRELLAAGRDLAVAAGRTAELRLLVRELRQEKGITDARGALEYSLGLHDATTREGLTAFLSDDVLGAQVLTCANASAKVRGDNGGKPHTPSSLAALLLVVKTRLNVESHDRRSPVERAGEPLVLPRVLNFSERHVLTCLLDTLGYEIAATTDDVE